MSASHDLRERLPNRRRQRIIAFDYEGRRFIAGFGFYSDGRIGLSTLMHALTRASNGLAAGPLGRALDLLAEGRP